MLLQATRQQAQWLAWYANNQEYTQDNSLLCQKEEEENDEEQGAVNAAAKQVSALSEL